jgi:hypothetical protein
MLGAMLKSLLAAVAVAFLAAGAAHAGKPPPKKADPPAAPAKKKGPEKPENAKSDPRASAPAAPDDAAPTPSNSAGGPAPAGGNLRGMSRIEFDDRLIKGQTNKANAIYLFERRESALRSLLKKRTDFHDEIDETLE